MLTVNIDEIQKNLISYFHQVAAGESVIIIESGKPIAEIKPVSPHLHRSDLTVYVQENLQFQMILMIPYLMKF